MTISEILQTLFFNPNANFELVSAIIALGTIVVTIALSKKETSLSLIKERYENLIFPLFSLLEPFLYQKEIPDSLPHILDFIEKQKIYADGKLIELAYYCRINPSIKDFINLCKYADKSYDYFCRKLGLRLRSVSYRLNRNQYSNYFYLFFYIIRILSVQLLIFATAMIGFLSLLSLLVIILENASLIVELSILLFLLVLLLILNKTVLK